MVSLEVFCRLEIFPFPYVFSHNLFKQQGFPPSSGFRQSHKIVEGGTNYTKISLSSWEEKHVDTYIVMSTNRNKTKIKYYEWVPQKWRSQFSTRILVGFLGGSFWGVWVWGEGGKINP